MIFKLLWKARPDAQLLSRSLPFLSVLSLLGLAGCASVATAGDPDFVITPGMTFAWDEDALDHGLDEQGLPIPWSDFVAATANGLTANGLTLTDIESADVLARGDLIVVTRTRNNDAYFNLYVAEKFEEADYLIELHEPGTDRLLWRGECGHRLRFTERATGGASTLRWRKTEDERVWEVSEAVERILAKLPKE